MKKAAKIITTVFIIIAMLTGCAALYFFYRDRTCASTQVPENLSTTATVRQYFEYWNDGNSAGMKLLTAESASVGESENNYLPSADLFCNISCLSCELLEEKAENYDCYADSAIVSTDFTYERSLGFGDDTIPSEAKGWEFHLVKQSETSGWKIISVDKGGQ